MPKATTMSITGSFQQVNFLSERTAETTDQESEKSFVKLSDYENGAIFITHYSGNSEWERHSNGDELVQVIEGETTLFILNNGKQTPHLLNAGELIVVPKNTWHRFETPKEVKVMSITPQPTDHSIELPIED